MNAPTESSVQAKPTSVAETLRAARALIEDPKRWTKGALAKPTKRSSFHLPANDPKAGAWCAVGAIGRIDGEHEADALRFLAAVIEVVGNEFFPTVATAKDKIIGFNDRGVRRHKEVMRKFDEAIALAESRS